MLHILLGSNKQEKTEFVNQLKDTLSDGLWGKDITSLLGKEVSSVRQMQELLRSTGFSGQRLIILWEVDGLKSAVVKLLPRLIREYVLDNDSLMLVLEGSGQKRSVSGELARTFNQWVRIFGELEERSYFDLARAVIKGEKARALELAQYLELDRYSFQQFTGAMRYLVESETLPLSKKATLLSALVDLDIEVRLGRKSPLWGILDLTDLS